MNLRQVAARMLPAVAARPNLRHLSKQHQRAAWTRSRLDPRMDLGGVLLLGAPTTEAITGIVGGKMALEAMALEASRRGTTATARGNDHVQHKSKKKQQNQIILPKGATVFKSDVKDELVFDGTDNASLSLACARVNQACNIGNKDERKFLDGIFVSEKTLTNPKED